MNTLEKKVSVKNKLGLHARPATLIVQLLEKYQSEVTFTHNEKTINAKSILNILMLAAQKDSQITIKVIGDDAEDVMEDLVACFEDHFGEGS